ncbi:hypothetical protein V6Z11_A07G239600 [Gossypium hirsutum]
MTPYGVNFKTLNKSSLLLHFPAIGPVLLRSLDRHTSAVVAAVHCGRGIEKAIFFIFQPPNSNNR